MPVQDELDASAADVGALDGPGATAELLVGIAHTCRDRGTWGGSRALTYWDRLPDKVRTSCYSGPTTAAWWERMCRVLGCSQPRDRADRGDLARALGGGDDHAVLEQLRTHTEALCLRVRLAAQRARDERNEPSAPEAAPAVELDHLEVR